MKRLTSVALGLGLVTLALGCGDSDDEQAASTTPTSTTAASSKCPKSGAADAAYSSKFDGSVSKDKTKHVLRVTRDGKPVSGLSVCVNTAMVGMTSMRYAADGRELAPGRYEVGMKFEMAGRYTGNVIAKQGAGSVSIPVEVKVAEKATRSEDSMKSDDSMEGMESDDSKSGDSMKSDDAMEPETR